MSVWAISHAFLWLAVAVMAVMIFALARQIGILYERIAPAGALMLNRRLQVGAPAPELTIADLHGGPVSIGGRQGDGKSRMLFFLAPDCQVCKSLLPSLKSAARKEAAWLEIVLASDGETEVHERFVRERGLEDFRYVASERLGRDYGVARLPYAVLVDEEGRIASFGIVNSREHLESLFEAKERNVASMQDYLQRRRGKNGNGDRYEVAR